LDKTIDANFTMRSSFNGSPQAMINHQYIIVPVPTPPTILNQNFFASQSNFHQTIDLMHQFLLGSLFRSRRDLRRFWFACQKRWPEMHLEHRIQLQCFN
jgi:hypothetical protein